MMKKKLISILMALCMVVTMLPTTAFATEGGTPSGASNVQDSGNPAPVQECDCKVKCIAADAENEIEAVIKVDCPVCGAEGAALTQCKGVAATRLTAARAAEVGIFAGRYNYQQVFDCQRSIPDGGSVGEKMVVSFLRRPLHADNTIYAEDEIKGLTFFFKASSEDTNFSLHSVDSDGIEIEVFAKGTIIALASKEFLYLGIGSDERELGWFISNGGPVTGNSLTYTIEIPGPITHAEGEEYRANTQPGLSLPAAATVTFDANGGSVSPATAQTGTDGKLTTLPTPTRSGYSFDGWFTAEIGGTAVTTETVFTTNTTIYAHWTENTLPAATYTVTFNANGGSVSPATAQTGTDGKLTTLPTPTRSGYSFDGWFTAESGGEQVTTETVFTANTTIYAHWTENTLPAATYTVTFDANGGTVSPATAQTGTDGKLATLPTPTRSGYRFDGWFTAKSGGTAVTTNTVFTANTTIYARWTYTGGGGSTGGGSSSDGGSSSSSTVTPPASSSNVESKGDGKVIASKVAEETAAAIAEAKKNGTGTRTNIVAINPVYVAPQTLQDMAVAAQKAGGTAWLFADSVVDGKVMVRIYMNTANAQSFKENILLGGIVSGKAVDYTKNKFVNFDNKMAIVSLAQQKPFAVSTEIAAKVDLTGLDTKTLFFYSYDRATNKYYPISAPSYRMDKSGYLHFNTTRGGDIVITDKPLTLKK